MDDDFKRLMLRPEMELGRQAEAMRLLAGFDPRLGLPSLSNQDLLATQRVWQGFIDQLRDVRIAHEAGQLRSVIDISGIRASIDAVVAERIRYNDVVRAAGLTANLTQLLADQGILTERTRWWSSVDDMVRRQQDELRRTADVLSGRGMVPAAGSDILHSALAWREYTTSVLDRVREYGFEGARPEFEVNLLRPGSAYSRFVRATTDLIAGATDAGAITAYRASLLLAESQMTEFSRVVPGLLPEHADRNWLGRPPIVTVFEKQRDELYRNRAGRAESDETDADVAATSQVASRGALALKLVEAATLVNEQCEFFGLPPVFASSMRLAVEGVRLAMAPPTDRREFAEWFDALYFVFIEASGSDRTRFLAKNGGPLAEEDAALEFVDIVRTMAERFGRQASPRRTAPDRRTRQILAKLGLRALPRTASDYATLHAGLLHEGLRFVEALCEAVIRKGDGDEGDRADPWAAKKAGDQLLDYKDQDQPWLGELPIIVEEDRANLRDFLPGVFILTAVLVEWKAVVRRMKPLEGRDALVEVIVRHETYVLGRLGHHDVALALCEAGSSRSGGSTLVTNAAIEEWRPKAVIAPGIAFGIDATKQRIGDVLVSLIVHCYELARVQADVTIRRGESVQAGLSLSNRFRHTSDWRFARPDEELCGIHLGAVLSGEKLVDSAEFKAALLVDYPEAIGGEMEAVGIYAACRRANIDWIVVKSICDWADGNKHKAYQELAAAAAVSLVEHVLSKRNALDGLVRPGLKIPVSAPAAGRDDPAQQPRPEYAARVATEAVGADIDTRPRAWLSHGADTKEFAERLARGLEDSGIRVWLEQWEVRPGDRTVRKLYDEGVGTAVVCIAVVSPASLEDEIVRSALEVAFTRQADGEHVIIPVLVGDVRAPMFLRASKPVIVRDTEHFDGELRDLTAAVAAHACERGRGE